MKYDGNTYKTPQTQCKDCPNRYPACHDHCESYKKAREMWAERQKEIRREKHKASVYRGFAVESVIRNKRR